MADREAPQDRYIESWKSFVLKTVTLSVTFLFADSGHAPLKWSGLKTLVSDTVQRQGTLRLPRAWKDRHVAVADKPAPASFEAFNVRS